MRHHLLSQLVEADRKREMMAAQNPPPILTQISHYLLHAPAMVRMQ